MEGISMRRGNATTNWTRGTRGAIGNKSSSSCSYDIINKKERGQRPDQNSSSDGGLAGGGCNVGAAGERGCVATVQPLFLCNGNKFM
jgi:hypothetical protein